MRLRATRLSSIAHPRRLGAAWTPTALGSSLALWLDADDASTITHSAGLVAEWRDKGAGARHVSQPNPSRRPAYLAGGLAGRDVLGWGSAANAKGLVVNLPQPITLTNIFIVARYDGPNPFDTYTGALTFDYADVPDLPFLTHVEGAIWWGTAKFVNGAASSGIIALPAIQSPFVARNELPPTPNRTVIFVGSDRGFGDRGWRGVIAEIVGVSGAMDASGQSQMEGYLAHKWGLADSLPSNHPFRNAPPTV